MDEAGARVYLKNMNIPKEVVAFEQKIEKVKKEKAKAVRVQNYIEAKKN